MKRETTLASIPTVIVSVVAVVICLAYGAIVDVQVAVLGLATLAAVGAVTRVFMRAGVALSNRRRTVDVAIMGIGAVALAFLGLTTPLV
jgi:hypothetical protein